MTGDEGILAIEISIPSTIVPKLHLVDRDQLVTPDAERFSRLSFDDPPPCTTDFSASVSQVHNLATKKLTKLAGVCDTGGSASAPDSPSKVLERAFRTVAPQISSQPPCEVALEGLAFFVTEAMASFSQDTDWVDTLFQTSSLIKARRDLRRAPVSVGDASNPELGKNRGKSLKRRASETALLASTREIEDKAPAVVLSTASRRKLMRALPKHARLPEGTFKELRFKRLAQRSVDDLQLLGTSQSFSQRQLSNNTPKPRPPPLTGPSSLKRNPPSGFKGSVNTPECTALELARKSRKRIKSS